MNILKKVTDIVIAAGEALTGIIAIISVFGKEE